MTAPPVTDRSCAVCNGPLGTDSRARYCTPACRQEAYRQRRQRDRVLPAAVADETVVVPGYPTYNLPAGIVAELSRADSMTGRLQRACLVALAEHNDAGEIPTSLRFLYYELSQRGVIAKDHDTPAWGGRLAPSRTWSQELSVATMHLRRKRLVPWNWIVDETRQISDWYYADTVADGVVDSVAHARIDAWAGQWPPLIICESRSLVGVLRRIAADYLCPIAPTNGQAGGFIVTDLVPQLADNNRPVIYLGDLDHHGELIEDNTKTYIAEHTGRTFRPWPQWQRIAITPDQVDTLDLDPVIDDKGREKYETEALGQTRIQQILTDRLDERLPEPLDVVRRREREQQERVRRALEHLDLDDEQEPM